MSSWLFSRQVKGPLVHDLNHVSLLRFEGAILFSKCRFPSQSQWTLHWKVRTIHLGACPQALQRVILLNHKWQIQIKAWELSLSFLLVVIHTWEKVVCSPVLWDLAFFFPVWLDVSNTKETGNGFVVVQERWCSRASNEKLFPHFPWLLDNSLLNWCIASLKHTYRSLPKSAYLSTRTVLTHESLVSQRSVGLLVNCFILCMEQWKLRHWWLSPRPPGERVAEPVVALWGIHTQSQASTNLDISLYHLISDWHIQRKFHSAFLFWITT